ncbi:MAG TPA: arginine deiminase-related protein [Candidatus Egerieousia sp.]|nr:arginine deiminase-related protein [Candidatus Egerieousia sp.]
MQTTNKVLMVRPARFAFNEQTAENNAFQQNTTANEEAAQKVQRQALKEFDAYVRMLQEAGVDVIVAEDTPQPFTPDSIFPNNCFSVHCGDGAVDPCNAGAISSGACTHEAVAESTLVLYPMFAPNRREERKKLMQKLSGLKCDKVVDLTGFEKQNKFLEGTGSMVIDREHRLAFCCKSPRTNEDVLERFAERLDYDYFLFNAADENGTPIYHTNVMMSIGSRFAVVCLDSITDLSERERLIELLEENGKEIVEISFEQMGQFAGNMLELHSGKATDKAHDGSCKKLLVMSATAKAALTLEQIKKLEEDVTIVAPDIHTIEIAGGGSARCMLAEIYR